MVKKIYLSGGLGNVLFQLFIADVIADKGYNVVIYDNLIKESFITKHILKWKIHDNYSSYFSEFPITERPTILVLIDLIYFWLSRILNRSFFKRSYEKLNLQRSDYFLGYFQDRELLKNESQVFSIFLLKCSSRIVKTTKYENVIHLRLRDSNHITRNIKIFRLYEHLDRLCIVTDSTNDAAEYCPLISSIVSESVLHDFSIMVSAQSTLICADSTLSWWASHLVDSKVRVVIPERLYNQLGYHGKNLLEIITD